MSGIPIFDVFQKGLIRGSEHLPHDPKKAYAYVEHPHEGWRVYLRSCVFLHTLMEPFHPMHFLVVHDRKKRMSSPAWEPPKGQMEGKELMGGKRKSVIDLLKDNVLRETEEESHITQVEGLRHTGLVFQSQETSYPANHYFQYHIFQGFLTQEQIKQSYDTFDWIKEHPAGFERWKRDRKEKNAVAWFNPRTTRLNPRWCPDIAALYIKQMQGKR